MIDIKKINVALTYQSRRVALVASSVFLRRTFPPSGLALYSLDQWRFCRKLRYGTLFAAAKSYFEEIEAKMLRFLRIVRSLACWASGSGDDNVVTRDF